MSISSADLIAFAQALATDVQQQEAGHRAALSRAYYAAFHDCITWHTNLPVPGSLGGSTSTGTHAELYEHLKNPDASLAQGVKTKSRQRAYALRDLHGRRVKADYHISAHLSVDEARQAISNAQAIMALI